MYTDPNKAVFVWGMIQLDLNVCYTMHGAFLLYLEEKLKKKTNNIHVYTYLIQRNTTYDIQIELSPFYYNVQN